MYQPLGFSCHSRTFVYNSVHEWWLFCFCLQIVNFTKPAMIPPQSTVTPFFVQFLANGSDMAFSTILRVYTNASIFTVPIHCFDGKLKVSSVSVFKNYLVHCTFRPECPIKPYTCKSRSLHGLRCNKFNLCGWVTSLKCYIQLLVTCTWKVCHNFMSKLKATLSFKFECLVDLQ